jgi:type IV pilus modification protein PilV
MKSFRPIGPSRGFSLLEVLVAVVILSVGLLALALLQISLVRSGANTAAQSVALSLAKDKLEDLRTYTSIAGYRNLVSGSDGAAISVGGVSYTRSWTVARYANPTAGGDFASITTTGATPSGYVTDNEFKTLKVEVLWTDSANEQRRVSLEDAVGASDPTDSAKLSKALKAVRPRGPEIVITNPESVSGVIPIALGNGSDTAATNPRPIIVSQGQSSTVVETRFDVLTYLALNSTEAVGQLRVETSVVGCTCDATVASYSGYRPTYWNGVRYVAPTQYTYATKGLEKAGVTQSDRCVACCRDHRDPSAVAANADNPLYDRRRTDGHKHFNNDLTAEVTAGTYREACRMIRVDGFWRTATDMYDDTLNVLATGSNNDAIAPNTTMANNYEAFVLDYLRARFITGSASSVNTPSAYTGTLTAAEGTRGINEPSTPVSISPSATTPKWTHSRGLYIDYMENEAKDLIATAKTTCGTTDACILKYAAFTSINLTEIADWQATISTTPYTVNTNNIQVSNNSFATSVSDVNPVRGKVLPGSTPTVGETANARSQLSASNSGVALFAPIDADGDSTLQDDFQTFAIGNGVVTPGGGNFPLTMTGVIASPVDSGTAANPPKITFTIGAVSNDCTTNGISILPYTCTTTTGQALGTATTIQVANYNRQLDQTNGAPVKNACQNGSGPADDIKMPYRVIMDAIGATSSNASAIVSAGSVTNPDAVGLPAANGEYTTFTVTPIRAPVSPSTTSPDTITINMSNRLYKCPSNYTTFITNTGLDTSKSPSATECGGNSNSGSPVWSTTYVACPGTPLN